MLGVTGTFKIQNRYACYPNPSLSKNVHYNNLLFAVVVH